MKFHKHYCCSIMEMKINLQEWNRYILATQYFKRNNYLHFGTFKKSYGTISSKRLVYRRYSMPALRIVIISVLT